MVTMRMGKGDPWCPSPPSEKRLCKRCNLNDYWYVKEEDSDWISYKGGWWHRGCLAKHKEWEMLKANGQKD